MVLYLFHVAKLSHKILPVKKLHLYLIVTFFSLLQKTSSLRGEKNRKKIWSESIFSFLIIGKLLTLLSKVSNHSCRINKINDIRIIRYAKKRREKFDYRNLSRA